MLHPVFVIALTVILARMSAAALGTVQRTLDSGLRLQQQVIQFQGLDQVGVPDQPAVG